MSQVNLSQRGPIKGEDRSKNGGLMHLSMRLSDYFDALSGAEQVPVSLELILEPFGFFYHGDSDQSLLAGDFMACLAVEFGGDDWIDPTDIASAALELGHGPAGQFLEEAPWLMLQAAKRGHIAMV